MSSLAELPDLVGFFSYARRDDEHSQGALSRLRAHIFNELRMQLGRDFRLWQDTAAIPNGALWEEDLKTAISEATFFIPIVTPSSLASEHCRFEFQAFLDREAALGRKNLIFPLLYIRVPALEKEELWRQDDLLSIIGSRQYLDWQKLRHRGPSDPEVAEKIEQYCWNIAESLRRPQASPPLSASAQPPASAVNQSLPTADESLVPRIDSGSRPAPPDPAKTEQRKTEAAETMPAAPSKPLSEKAAPIDESARRRDSHVEPVQARSFLKPAVVVLLACLGVTALYIALSPSQNTTPAAPVQTALPQDSLPAFPGCEVFRTTQNPAAKSAALLIADYPNGQIAAQSSRGAAMQNGFRIVSEIRYPLNTSDYSSFLLQSQAANTGIIVKCGPSDPAFALQAKAFGVIR
jgi:hypothetical protein